MSVNRRNDLMDEAWMRLALEQAELAVSKGEVPVGAVLVHNDSVIATGRNGPISHHDPSHHAEIDCLRQAGLKLQNYRLNETSLYVTLEPCIMCYGAIVHARVKRLVVACQDPKTGFESAFGLCNHSAFNHTIEYTHGVLAEPASLVLKNFFKSRR